MENNLNSLIIRFIINAVAFIVLGVLMIFVPYEHIINFIFVLIGLYIIATNAVPCIAYWMLYNNDKHYLPMAIASTVAVSVGFMFIFWHDTVASIILAVVLIILPILRIVLSADKKEQAKKEIPYFVVAVLLAFVPASSIFSIVIKVFGGIFVAIGLFDIIYLVVMNKKLKNTPYYEPNNENPKNKDRVVIDAEVKDIK